VQSNLLIETWTPSLAVTPGNAELPQSRLKLCSRAALFVSILLAHGLVAWIVTRPNIAGPTDISSQGLIAVFIEAPDAQPDIQLPSVELLTMRVDVSAPPPLRIEEQPVNTFSPQRPFSAPRLNREWQVDILPYALKAGLAVGQRARVMLAVEVLPNGTTGSVVVERSGGSEIVDAAAIEYIRSCRWIPGSVQGQAAAMRIRHQVVLTITHES